MNEEIGTVISTLEGPSPSKVSFVVTTGIMNRGQFVEIDYSQGRLVGLVVDVFKTNKYFERAESVKEFEASGKKMFEQFPVSEWEYLVAETKPMGVYTTDGKIIRHSFPPSPGDKVRVASSETIEKFLGFDKNGLHLGEINFHGTVVKPNMSRLLKKHLAVLAMSGAGKSNYVKVMIEEVLNRKKEEGRVAVVVVDVHGEYTCFGEPATKVGQNDYSKKTFIIKSHELKIGVPKLNVGLVSSIVSGLSPPQKRELERILNSLKSEMRSGAGPFDLNRVEAAISQDKSINDATGRILLSWISNLKELDLFGKTDSPSVFDILRPGHLTVFDLSDETNLKKKQIIVSYFAQRFFFERKNGAIPPFLLVVEESHQFAPQEAKEESAISRRIIETIAREGRKFGACLCLVSQRPINLSTTALSQCNSNVILRVTNPYDLKHIGESSEGIDSKSLEMITTLAVGEALLVGEAVNHPVFFRVRKNSCPESRHEVSLEQAARLFEEKKEELNKEAAQFL